MMIARRESDYERNKNSVRVLLRNKGLGEDFIADVLERGLTDDVVSHLEGHGLAYDDVASIGRALEPPRPPSSTPSCDCTFPSGSGDSSRVVTGHRSDYLREHLGAILTTALREIADRKPVDPVEYLGQWLLYYRECEERTLRRREFETELLEERLKWRTTEPASPAMSVCREEEEDEEEEEGYGLE